MRVPCSMPPWQQNRTDSGWMRSQSRVGVPFLRRALSWVGTSLLVLVLELGLVASAGAQGEDDTEYKKLVQEALFEYKSGRWDEARALFEQAHTLNPNARTLRGIGMAAYEGRRYATAIRAFEEALEDERRPLTAEQRTEIRRWVKNAYRFVARYRVALEPAHATLQVDGNSVDLGRDGTLLLDAGRHEIVAMLDGHETVTRQAVASGGKRGKIHITLTPLSTSSEMATGGADMGSPQAAGSDPKPGAALPAGDEDEDGSLYETLAWVSVGGAAVGFGGALWAWLVHDAAADQWYDDSICKVNGLSREENCADVRESAETAKVWAIVGLSAGAALSVTAAVLFILSAGDASDDPSAGVGCIGGPGDLGVACTIAF